MPLPSRCLATPVSRSPYCPAAPVSLRRPGAALAVLHFSAASRPCTCGGVQRASPPVLCATRSRTLHLFTFPPALHCRCPALSACTAHTCAHTLHNHVPFVARPHLRTLRNRLSHVHRLYTALTHCLATATHFAYTPDAVTTARAPLAHCTVTVAHLAPTPSAAAATRAPLVHCAADAIHFALAPCAAAATRAPLVH